MSRPNLGTGREGVRLDGGGFTGEDMRECAGCREAGYGKGRRQPAQSKATAYSREQGE